MYTTDKLLSLISRILALKKSETLQEVSAVLEISFSSKKQPVKYKQETRHALYCLIMRRNVIHIILMFILFTIDVTILQSPG